MGSVSQIGQIFSRDTQAIFYNWKPNPVQRMLDFDFLCGAAFLLQGLTLFPRLPPALQGSYICIHTFSILPPCLSHLARHQDRLPPGQWKVGRACLSCMCLQCC